MERQIDLIGVPSSMGAFVPGQEQAPSALRDAGLLEALRNTGFDVRDHGDAAVRRWFPDRAHPHAQHVQAVADVALETAERVAASEGLALVLGGDCTIGLGSVAGLQRRHDGRIGLLYIDMHADMNVPSSVREGALDWMVLGHGLGIDGADPILAKAFDRAPLLDPSDVWLFAHGSGGTDFEKEQIARLGIPRTPLEEVASDPEASAAAALDAFAPGVDRLAVHFDVDTIDFVDLPLSQNADRNVGLTFDQALAALTVVLRHPGVAAFTITELNPAHDPDGSALARFVDGLAGALPRGSVPLR
jgi:arginase